MGMSAPAPRFHTVEMVRALIDEERAWPRYETLYGELVVTPAPFVPHQWVASQLHVELGIYLKRFPAVGEVYESPSEISWGRRDVLVQPDVFVVPRAMHEQGLRTRRWDVVRHLALAVEIISHSSRHRDRFGKRLLYQRQRVPHYWVVDVEQRLAETWTPEADLPVIERERLVWEPAEAAEPFVFDLAARFAAIEAIRGADDPPPDVDDGADGPRADG